MKNSFFTEITGREIPSFDLIHQDQPALFAYRTMEEIFDQSGDIPDEAHKHNFFTIIFVKSGEGSHIIDFTPYQIRDNRIFFLSPGQVHQVYTPSRPLGHVIMFSEEFLCRYNIDESFITDLGLFACQVGTPPLDVPNEISDRLYGMGKEIESLFFKEERYVNEAVAAWLKLFLIECNSVSRKWYRGNTQMLETGRDVMGKFRKLLEKNFRHWHQVSDYAQELSITPDYLNSVIKSSVGSTAKEFIQNRLVTEAKRMGYHTDLSSKEIAYSLGFNDPAHFSKFFKKAEGTSFSDFRVG
ncbi:MAG: helix-turn-helix transcriptional regulator [Bacteroidales bacterium]|jgi:AraC-like DNA-binding protein|nr:helix-turn-helix transcriptional regulator [Bacteroidales bacterium]MDD3299661.1 helix-turn-helix transcriptional regulator [Bacteroidales bacterium]MDD3843615.1 helix-turn-helix transcriptional regulator [Bacteroidales bacterium]MDD4618511.1 helix-turn-helix transcriptional regulator [Bacteroidales bacterium]